MARKIKIAVIGSGIGGATATAALHQRGFDVALYERATNVGEVGAGIQMGPNGVRVIYALGGRKELDSFAAAPPQFVSVAYDTAKFRLSEPLSSTAVQRFGAPYYMVHRADLHQLLQSMIPDAAIHTGKNFIGCEQRGDIAVARFEDGTEIEADVIVGADGVRSAMREQLVGKDTPRYTGQTCFRAMLPMSEVADAIGPDRVNLRVDNVGWIGPKGHVICYPIRAGNVLNIFAGYVNDDWAEESWTVPTSVEEMQKVYAGWHPALLHLMARSEAGHKWGLHDRDPLQSWTRGRMTLLGDTAHPMMPTLAQGGCQAIEDGWAIARHLDEGRDDLEAALQAYESERRPRASRVQLQARQQFQNNKIPNAPPPLSRDWIFSFDTVNGREYRPDAEA